MHTFVSTRTRTASAVAVIAVCLAVGLGGCGSSPRTEPAPVEPGSTAPERLGPSVPYDLYTHCGISEARYEDRYYELVPPLHDGSFNPPAGWGNPSQRGTLTPVSKTEVVFTDDAGHRVTFTLRPGATTWKRICQ
ncbi:hypothetical protein I6A84_06890 [Frankia sp. CNm7]|uniref:Uncharacterized protein n=1 Tax=Frankia nepalensis TaxID=1836974 RepID=A0A937RKE4_9ACTN|nr:hypothetical protein [Frankia nepalensis]MBL7501621.1 hypothetical protein [Frankia nepalensis]MBL7514318.1 hypothetical protein [Frankia nepalensis]MBL7517857.1 hypothetical protein [Frankia nepalensis]MBL7628043.1 hypothetical protein [Frankia nepalensis]